jgi:adenosylmethionine-8-amino-7-oxononanoate aminotransferase
VNEYDRRHVWHPYTSIIHPLPTYEVVDATGVRIRLADGREVIDGMSSWWCAIHGYDHPTLNEALRRQSEAFSHVMFGGFTHAPATDLARRLVETTPEGLEYVFLSDSGSVAVEVAIKMAIQYWHALGRPDRHKLLTIRGGYHGDTFGAMSVCDPVTGMHGIFTGTLPQQHFAPRPETRFGRADDAGVEADLEALAAVLEAHSNEIAALILEPIVQGAGGMWFYSADYLRGAAELCRAHDTLLVFDEIATGFGRTGELFAANHAGVAPDILCVGKALTGGMMTLAATVANDRVRDGLSTDGGVLMHGPTFMGNALACSVANASIDLLLEGDWQANVKRIEARLRSGLERWRGHEAVTDVRCLGAIGVVETDRPVDVAAMQKVFVERGVWIRPFGHLVYLMPPYITSDEDLDQLCQAVGPGLDLLLQL